LGARTRSAIRSFQQKRGLVVDGVVGPKTEAALIKAAGGAATTKTTKAPSREARQEECDKWRFSCNRYYEGQADAVKDVCGTNQKCLNNVSTFLVQGKEKW
jgi:peptidoglycan hydrolase-like protein with peptidoglycan-binding domain